MQGIDFIRDDKQNIRFAVIDLNLLQDTFDDFFGALITGNNTKGVEFLRDDKGNIIKAKIDLLVHQKTFDEFFSELIVKGKDDNTKPSNDSRENKITNLMAAARSFLSTKYQSGGTSLFGMDCSGFSTMAYKSIGINLPRTSRDQALTGKATDKNNLQAGDLVFFATGTDAKRISHVGLIVKGGTKGQARMIHASTSRGVIEDDPFSAYYEPKFISATRVI
jgi:probable lipoprotein NlpC